MTADEIMEAVRKLTDDERYNLFSEIRGEFCTECGRTDPRCQCWNDE